MQFRIEVIDDSVGNLAVNIPAAFPLLGDVDVGISGQEFVNSFYVALFRHFFPL